MKKTFVFDMPEDCTECKFNDDDWRCNLTGRYVSWDEVPDHCPFSNDDAVDISNGKSIKVND